MADNSSTLSGLFKRVTDPEFKRGYRDGMARRPRAYFTDNYLEGYRQGLATAVVGTPEYGRRVSITR